MNQLSPEVIVATDAFTSLTDDIVRTLKRGSVSAERGRMRFCAHQTAEDPLHEMLISLARTTYIRPHRHSGKSESVHVVEGCGDLVRFDEAGGLVDVLRIAPHGSGRCFYYRMATPQYHMLIVRTDVLVVHETTNGPFRPDDTEFAPWAPEEGNIEGRAAFLAHVEKEIVARRASLQEPA